METTLKIGQELHSDSIVYRIESVLGQGSFGVTYKAKAFTVMKGRFGEELVETNTPKAIKEFFMREINQRDASGSITGMSEGSLSYNYAQKFKKEAENLAGMNHPNIVRVIDFVTANNTFYYVMDYIEGENLNDYLKRHQMNEQEAIEIITEVAKALDYMHREKHMLHLDLKPGNVMRRKSDGHIFLIDFGLSKHYNDDGQPDTSTTIGLGTEGYAPLEQGKRASAQNAFRPTIDVYALGGTLFKLLTGETPPAASDILGDEDLLCAIMKKHTINTHLQNVIVKAMDPIAKQRTASVAEFLKSLTGDDSLETEQLVEEDVTSVNTSPKVSDDEETKVTSVDENSKENKEEKGVAASSRGSEEISNTTAALESSHAMKELPTLNFIEAVKLLVQKNFSFKGRSRRSEFMWMMLTIIPIVLLCFLLLPENPHYYPLLFIISVPVALFGLATMVRRLHDINISGWWAIIPFTLIELCVIIYLFFYL